VNNQFDRGWLILTINQQSIEMPVFEPGSGHTQVAASFHRNANILQNSAEHLDGLGIRAHQ
jgi:hypothetical protein